MSLISYLYFFGDISAFIRISSRISIIESLKEMFKMISLIALAVWSMLAMFTFHGELAFGGQLSYDYQLSNPMFHELIGRIENSSPETINQLDDFLSLQKDLIDSENYETDLNVMI